MLQDTVHCLLRWLEMTPPCAIPITPTFGYVMNMYRRETGEELTSNHPYARARTHTHAHPIHIRYVMNLYRRETGKELPKSVGMLLMLHGLLNGVYLWPVLTLHHTIAQQMQTPLRRTV